MDETYYILSYTIFQGECNCGNYISQQVGYFMDETLRPFFKENAVATILVSRWVISHMGCIMYGLTSFFKENTIRQPY
jgi:hypothetical protein